MKKLIALLLLALLTVNLTGQTKLGPRTTVGGTTKTAANASGGGGLNGFTAFKTITIDPAQVVGASDLSDFPMLFTGTFAWLKTTANGGSVTDAEGDDIVYTSDAGCTTNLKFEREAFNGSDGFVTDWIKIPTLSTSVSTVIYQCFGKAAITTFQGDPENVWDSNYKAVYHMKEDPAGSAPQMLDSTANNNDLTAISDPTQDLTSQFNGGLSFDGTAAASKTQNASINDLSTITVSAWMNPTTFGSGGQGRIIDKTQSGTTGFFVAIIASEANLRFVRLGATVLWETGNSSIATGTWASIAITYDYSNNANDPIFYKNGSAISSTELIGPPVSTTPNDGSNDLIVGDRTAADRGFSGDMDELRISSTVRSADWVATEHNNQSTPSTFYTVT